MSKKCLNRHMKHQKLLELMYILSSLLLPKSGLLSESSPSQYSICLGCLGLQRSQQPIAICFPLSLLWVPQTRFSQDPITAPGPQGQRRSRQAFLILCLGLLSGPPPCPTGACSQAITIGKKLFCLEVTIQESPTP